MAVANFSPTESDYNRPEQPVGIDLLELVTIPHAYSLLSLQSEKYETTNTLGLSVQVNGWRQKMVTYITEQYDAGNVKRIQDLSVYLQLKVLPSRNSGPEISTDLSDIEMQRLIQIFEASDSPLCGLLGELDEISSRYLHQERSAVQAAIDEMVDKITEVSEGCIELTINFDKPSSLKQFKAEISTGQAHNKLAVVVFQNLRQIILKPSAEIIEAGIPESSVSELLEIIAKLPTISATFNLPDLEQLHQCSPSSSEPLQLQLVLNGEVPLIRHSGEALRKSVQFKKHINKSSNLLSVLKEFNLPARHRESSEICATDDGKSFLPAPHVSKQGSHSDSSLEKDYAHQGLTNEMVEEELVKLRGNVQRLLLNGNKLTLLPPITSTFTKLTFLHLSENSFNILPDQILSLEKLRKLILARNQLSNLPESFAQKLSQLEHLDLSNNEFESIPGVIYALTRLENLDFSSNHLTQISSDISKLQELTCLNLQQNKIEILPNSILTMTSLRRLGVGGNARLKLSSRWKKKEDLEIFE